MVMMMVHTAMPSPSASARRPWSKVKMGIWRGRQNLRLRTDPRLHAPIPRSERDEQTTYTNSDKNSMNSPVHRQNPSSRVGMHQHHVHQ